MEEEMQDVLSENPGASSESENTTSNVVQMNDISSAIGKMTSVDSGIETGNDSNDSAVVPIETRRLTMFTRHRNYLDTIKRWNLEMQEIDQPFSSISSDAIEAACSRSKTYSPGSSSLSSSNCGPPIIYGCRRLASKHPAVEKKLTFRLPIKTQAWSSCIIDVPKSRERVKGLRRLMTYVTECGERRLRSAASRNDVDEVERLLRQNVNPNTSDEQLRTPLHLSSCRGYTEIVRLLLMYGANPTLKDCIGNTPLHLAAATSKIAVVTLLLEAGCDPLSPDLHGYNPLQLAETKLRLLQNCKGDDMLRIKSEVHEVVNMLVAYLKNRNGFGEQVDALTTFCSRLTLSNTSNQVQDEVRDLLCNIDSLSLKS